MDDVPQWLIDALDALPSWMLYKDRVLKGMAIPEAALTTETWTLLRGTVDRELVVRSEVPYEGLGVVPQRTQGRKPAVDILVSRASKDSPSEFMIEVKRLHNCRDFKYVALSGVKKDIQRVGAALAKCPENVARRGFVVVTHQNLLPSPDWCKTQHKKPRAKDIRARGTRSILTESGEGTITRYAVRKHLKALHSATTRRGMWISLIEVLPSERVPNKTSEHSQ